VCQLLTLKAARMPENDSENDDHAALSFSAVALHFRFQKTRG